MEVGGDLKGNGVSPLNDEGLSPACVRLWLTGGECTRLPDVHWCSILPLSSGVCLSTGSNHYGRGRMETSGTSAAGTSSPVSP